MMESARLTITLIPTAAYPDPIGRRVLQLDPRNYSAVIGRSSKVEYKNLIPAEDNAWFDNRVMSRAHAEFSAIPKFQEVYLMDTNSMHGTWVNGVKLTGGRKTLLETDDILTFGATVSRGAENFEPLKVRLELKWEGVSAEHPLSKPLPSINTFTVPEDDDDNPSEVEILQQEAGRKDSEAAAENDITFVQIIDSDDDDDDYVYEASLRVNSSEISNEDGSVLSSGDSSSDTSDLEKELEKHGDEPVEPPKDDDVSMKETAGSSSQSADSEQSSSDGSSAVSPCTAKEQEQQGPPPTSPQTHDAHRSEEAKQPHPFDLPPSPLPLHQPTLLDSAMDVHAKATYQPALEGYRASLHDRAQDNLGKVDSDANPLIHKLQSDSKSSNSNAEPPKAVETQHPRNNTAHGPTNDEPNKHDTVLGPIGVDVHLQTKSHQDASQGGRKGVTYFQCRPDSTISQGQSSELWDSQDITSAQRKCSPRGQPVPSNSFGRAMLRGSCTSARHMSPPYSYPHMRHSPYYTQGPFAPSIPHTPMPQVNPVSQGPPTPSSSTNFGIFGYAASPDAFTRSGDSNAYNCPPPAGGYYGRGLSPENFASSDAWLSARLDNMLDRMKSTQDANANMATNRSRPLSVSRSDPRTIVQEGGDNALKRKHDEIESQVEVAPVGKPSVKETDVPDLVVFSTAAPTAPKNNTKGSEPCVQSTEVLKPAVEAIQGTQDIEETAERPCKRPKTTHSASTMTRYAATALAGVVVGGVGTIMALAALPAGFFE